MESGAGDASVEVEGIVCEALPNSLYSVALAGGQKVFAHPSGRLRLHLPRVLPGDRVRVRLSPYDRSRGRIVERYR